MNSKIFATLFAVLFLVFSCKKSDIESTNSDEDGILKISLTGDFELTDQTKSSDADESEPWLNGDNYSVLITKNTESYAGWSTVSQMPDEVTLQPGTYSISAWWGSNVAAAFDSPFYYTDQLFTINSLETTDVALEVSLLNAIVNIEYTDEFLFQFSGYPYVAVELHNQYTGDSPLRVSRDETRTPYVYASELYLRLYVVKSDGSTIYYGLTTIDEVLAKDRITVKLTSDVDDTTLGFGVQVSDETNRIDQDLVINYSDAILAEPEIKLSFASPLSVTECIVEDYSDNIAYAKCEAGIESLTLKHSSSILTAAGIANEVSLLDPSVLSQLEALGITVDTDVDATSSIVNFTEFAAISKLTDVTMDSETHSFEVDVTDRSNETTSKSFDITINKLEYTIPAVPLGMIWTMEATAYTPTTTQISQDLFMKKIECKYSSDGGSSWNTLSLNSDGNYSMTGLTANSSYKVKYIYDGRFEDVVDFTTLPILSITNNGLETYTATKQSYSSSNAPVYNYTFTGWGTNNATTMSKESKYNYCCWPSTEATTDKYAGSIAALIQTIGYGNGNTATDETGICYNVAPGKLYLGSSETGGEAFATKPTSMNYYYKFDMYNSEPHYVEVKIENRTGSTTTVLGSGTYSGSTERSAYTKNSIDITYSSGNEDLAPTHITVNFRSTVSTSLSKSDGDVEIIWGDVGAVTWPLDEGLIDSIYRGSRLWIDNIQFEYNK